MVEKIIASVIGSVEVEPTDKEPYIITPLPESAVLGGGSCIALTGSVHISAGITAILPGSFTFSKITELVIDEGVTEIGVAAFFGCEHLKSVVLPRSLNVIGTDAFKGCTALEYIHLKSDTLTLPRGVFWKCPNLQKILCDNPDNITVHPGAVENPRIFVRNVTYEITIPEDVAEIPDNAYAGMEELRIVHTHPNIKKVGSGAFAGCKKLEKIFLGDSVTEMGDGVFTNCPKLVLQTHFHSVPYDKREGHRFELCLLPDVPITNYPTRELLKFDMIRETLNEIGADENRLIEVFGETTSGSPLTKIPVLKSSVSATEKFVIEDRILVRYNGNEERVKVPEGIIGINELAFYGNTNIRTITLPTSLIGFDIGDEDGLQNDDAGMTFKCLPNLEYISMPGTPVFYDEKGVLYSCVDEVQYRLCVPIKHQYSGWYNTITETTNVLKYEPVQEALNVMGVTDKEAAVIERLGECTTMALAEVYAVFYGVDIKPKADAIIERYVLDRQLQKAEDSKKSATPEQKAARNLLFGKK